MSNVWGDCRVAFYRWLGAIGNHVCNFNVLTVAPNPTLSPLAFGPSGISAQESESQFHLEQVTTDLSSNWSKNKAEL
jgi:hypothetical protein